jgi:hypothetical protein
MVKNQPQCGKVSKENPQQRLSRFSEISFFKNTKIKII